jgi:hypothetical protein
MIDYPKLILALMFDADPRLNGDDDNFYWLVDTMNDATANEHDEIFKAVNPNPFI